MISKYRLLKTSVIPLEFMYVCCNGLMDGVVKHLWELCILLVDTLAIVMATSVRNLITLAP